MIETYDPKPWLTPKSISPRTPPPCAGDMIGVVENGTATRPADPGLRGRGQDRHGPARHRARPISHTWIIAFAGPPGQAPSVAVAVVVLNQPGSERGDRRRIAAPIARAVMEKVLQIQTGG